MNGGAVNGGAVLGGGGTTVLLGVERLHVYISK